MKPEFVITGFPRSRTAWLAALFSTPKLPVYHDIVTYPPTAERYAVSDPCVALFEQFHSLGDNVPVVFVARDEDEVRAAMVGEYGDASLAFWKSYRANADKFLTRRRESLAVADFRALDDFSTVNTMYKYATRGKELDRYRFDIFCRLNISQDTKRAQQALAADKKLGMVH